MPQRFIGLISEIREPSEYSGRLSVVLCRGAAYVLSYCRQCNMAGLLPLDKESGTIDDKIRQMMKVGAWCPRCGKLVRLVPRWCMEGDNIGRHVWGSCI